MERTFVMVTLGFVLSGIAAEWISTRSHPSGREYRGFMFLGGASLVLTGLAFLPTDPMNRVAAIIVLILTAFGVFLAVLLVHSISERSTGLSQGAVAGSILVLLNLYCFGGMFSVRILLAPDPAGGVWDGVRPGTILGLVVPLLPLLIAQQVNVWPDAFGEWLGRSRQLGRALPQRVGGWVRGAFRRLGAALARVGVATIPVHDLVGNARSVSPALQAWRVSGVLLVLGLLPLLSGLLPLFSDPVSGAHLEFLGIAVPEYLEIIFIVVWSSLLIRSRGILIVPVDARGRWRSMREYLIITVVALGPIALSSFARNDWGALLAPVLAAATMTWMLLVRDRSAIVGESAQRRTPLRTHWHVVVVVVAVSVGGLGLIAQGESGRFGAWLDPWQYLWSAPEPSPLADGVSPPQEVVNVLVDEIDGEPVDPLIRENPSWGTQRFVDVDSSMKSQMAHALVVVEGGGLVGRGLGDTEAGILGITRTNDLILASIWSKLGGVTVALVVLSFLLLWRVLLRYPAAGWSRSPRDIAHLVATGVGSACFLQVLYVMLVTVDLLPHTGVPVPLVSWSPQAGAALGFAVFLAGWFAAGSAPSEPGGVVASATTGRWLRNARVSMAGALMVMLVVVTLLVGATMPYRIWGGLDPEDPVYDGLRAYVTQRGSVTLAIDGRDALRSSPGLWNWTELDGLSDVGLPDKGALTGLVRVGEESGNGLVEVLLDRGVLPSPELENGHWSGLDHSVATRLDLTLEGDLQDAASVLVQRPNEGGNRFAAGLVALDANTGAMLAVATSPGAVDDALPQHVVDQVAEIQKDHLGDYWILDDGTWRRVSDRTLCSPGPGVPDPGCVRFRLNVEPVPSEERERELLSYVGGDPEVEPPSVKTNRALSFLYGLGSGFKTVVAMSYLREGGTLDDKVQSPPTLTVGDSMVVENWQRSTCPGTTAGRITIDQAMAVSCNTAFVSLSQDIGWEPIYDTARLLGFTDQGPTVGWPATSTIPHHVDVYSLANATLGGGEVTGTPLQMAAVMGTIARGGSYVEPYLISAVDDAPAQRSAAVPVLTGQQAQSLSAALTRTVDEGGTLDALSVPEGFVVHAKTGTHDIYAGTPGVMEGYAKIYYWINGFVETGTRTVAFSVVIEGPSQRVASEQARTVVSGFLEALRKGE